MDARMNNIGKYEIKGELGTGGLGTVYRGWDPVIAREVAIKGIEKDSHPPGERDRLLGRLRQRAQAIGRLVHPRIVQIYDFIEDDRSAYIIMELVHGKTLAEYLDASESFRLWEVGQIISQTLDGIAYAHAQGVSHRNMKPSKIMINDDGRIKIGDFGTSCHVVSVPGSIEMVGSPPYLSPEQFNGEEGDAASDLYSVGVIAYELLTGRQPFLGSPMGIMRAAMLGAPPKPSLLNKKLTPEIDEVVAKAMARDRGDRFPTAKEFSDAFKHAISDAAGFVDRRARASAPDAARLLDAARMLQKDMIEENVAGAAAESDADRAILVNTGVRQARLLIVDDDERILAALKAMFRERYHVFTTTDGNKALDFIRRYHMHVIISDQRMPGMPGVELLRRSREITPQSVRILLTGYSDLAAIVGSVNEGEVYRFISKPWDNQALQALVAEASTIGLELAETRVPTVALPESMQAGVLVVDRDKEIFRVVRELIGPLCPVFNAADADSALGILKAHEIAAVVADVEAAQDQLASMLKLLKQEYPQILSIIASNARDAELAIELINQAQVFRILHKPINVATLKVQVLAALQRYLAYQQTPGLARAHKVEVPESLRTSGFARHILNGLASLRR